MREARTSADRRARWLSAGFFAAVLALCGVLLASRAQRATLAVQPAAYVSTLNAARTAGPAAPSAEPPPVNEVPPPATAVPATSATATAPPAGGALSASAAPEASAAPSPSARVPTQQEVQAAIHNTPVLMFSTSWCPVCARARQFFQANGISFVDHDIDKDVAASMELQRRSGGKAIPLIEVDGQQLRVGFSEQDTMQAVASSVARRLGVPGVRLVPDSAAN